MDKITIASNYRGLIFLLLSYLFYFAIENKKKKNLKLCPKRLSNCIHGLNAFNLKFIYLCKNNMQFIPIQREDKSE